MLVSHLDVVGAAPELFTPQIRDGRLYGRGSNDMKAGLAAAVIAAERLAAEARAAGGRSPLRGDLLVAGCADEEWESFGAEALVARYRPAAAILPERTDLDVTVEHGGFTWFAIESLGVEAAGAEPEKGVDAIALLGPVLAGIAALDRDLDARPRASYGRGSIHAATIEGGTQLPAYPGVCRLGVERCLIAGESVAQSQAEIDELLAAARAADPRFPASSRLVVGREPVALRRDDPVVLALVAAAAAASSGTRRACAATSAGPIRASSPRPASPARSSDRSATASTPRASGSTSRRSGSWPACSRRPPDATVAEGPPTPVIRMIRAVTLDFWNTLMNDFHSPSRDELRADRLREIVAPYGRLPDHRAVDAAFTAVWGHFDRIWYRKRRTPSTAESADVLLRSLRLKLPATAVARVVSVARRGDPRGSAAARRRRARDAAAAGRALRPGRRLRCGPHARPRAAPGARPVRPRTAGSGRSSSPTSTAARSPIRAPSSRRSMPSASPRTRPSTWATSSAPTWPERRPPGCGRSTSSASTRRTCRFRLPRPSRLASKSCRRSSSASGSDPPRVRGERHCGHRLVARRAARRRRHHRDCPAARSRGERGRRRSGRPRSAACPAPRRGDRGDRGVRNGRGARRCRQRARLGPVGAAPGRASPGARRRRSCDGRDHARGAADRAGAARGNARRAALAAAASPGGVRPGRHPSRVGRRRPRQGRLPPASTGGLPGRPRLLVPQRQPLGLVVPKWPRNSDHRPGCGARRRAMADPLAPAGDRRRAARLRGSRRDPRLPRCALPHRRDRRLGPGAGRRRRCPAHVRRRSVAQVDNAVLQALRDTTPELLGCGLHLLFVARKRPADGLR